MGENPELEARATTLEQLLEVQERTVIEQGERLERQRQELERSNQELERFAYVISHDLQEPLRMVSSFTQLLAQRYEGQLDEQADRYIGFAVGGAQRMQRLINDLLAYSRVTTQARELQPTPLDPVLDGVLADLAMLIEETGTRIEREPLPTVSADRTQVAQVFSNLLANAIHYRRPGTEPRVRIETREEADGFHRISVRDDGVGIDPRFHERIFVIFQRLDRSREEGTGLGLALCRRIVERHGGRLWVESAPDEGSTFHFTIPAVSPDEWQTDPT